MCCFYFARTYFLTAFEINFSQRLVSDELEAEETQTVDSDAENVDLFEKPEFIPRHFQFPKTEEDELIDEIGDANGLCYTF